MPSSGTTSYSVNELEIITDALESLGVYGAEDTIAAADVVLCRRKLNMIIKQWVAQTDFAPGLKMWTRRLGFLFLQKDQVSYALGPSGDECAASSYVTTTLTAGASGGASTITVASISGLSSGMRIGILLDSGSFQWTTINGAPSGATVTLTATLTGAASNGARVFAYTSKVVLPFEIETAVLHDTDGDDTPMDPHLSLEEYENIPSKTATGTPTSIYFQAKRTNAQIYIDCAPDDVTDVVRFWYLSYVEDSTGTTDTVDFPAEWFRPLSAQLAMDAAPSFGRPVSPELKLMRDESLRIAQNAHASKSTAFYESGPDCY